MRQRLAAIRGLLLDLDGTLYVGGQLLPGATDLFASMHSSGRSFVCLTNNSSARGSDYLAKLAGYGLQLTPDQLLTSGQATIEHLRATTSHRSVYLVGTDALRAEFAAADLELREDDPDCLVVGYDTTVDYHKLSVATRLLFAGKPYYATHPDRTCIVEGGLLPDIAATIAGLQAVTGRLPLVIGKPERPMVEAAAQRLDLPLSALAMVGDQLDTDMTMARRHGLLSILVLTGETDQRKLAQCDFRPDLVLQSVGELAQLL